MADITIKNVPVGAEDKVKEMAMVAIERFKASTELKIAEAKKTTYETEVDAIRVANELEKKYTKEEVVEEVIAK